MVTALKFWCFSWAPEMEVELFEIIKLFASVLTPIIVLIFGIIINRRIETIRISLAKEKEWKTKWSDTFYQTFRELNALVEDTLCTLFDLSQLNKADLGASIEADEKTKYLKELFSKISRIEFSLRTQLGCAPQKSDEMLTAINKLFDLIRNVISKKQGNLDEIHLVLIELNKKAMIAHSEILGLKYDDRKN